MMIAYKAICYMTPLIHLALPSARRSDSGLEMALTGSMALSQRTRVEVD